ncbi:dTDP-4-dehydrorhamnose reductase [Patescibacteria group bacterium]|nr:MAG: dTDP-4-dehydrorhamnose reductase [Patescibacteria group bacterium]
MKILILGAKGMLGQELVRAFSDMGELAAWDKEELDLTRPDEVSRRLTAFMPDLLLNAAAWNDVDRAEKEEEQAKYLNASLVGSIADICQILAITIVHFSTDYVFEGTKKDGYAEDVQPSPLSAYGRTKALGEKLLQQSGAEYYLIRTSRLFGAAGRSALAKKSFVDAMLELGRSRGEVDLIDEEVSSPTYVVDLAAATRRLVADKKPFGIYHLTNSGECTWYGFGQKIFELAGLKVKVNPVSGLAFQREAKRPVYSALRNTKLPPLRSWEQALGEYVKVRSI